MLDAITRASNATGIDLTVQAALRDDQISTKDFFEVIALRYL